MRLRLFAQPVNGTGLVAGTAAFMIAAGLIHLAIAPLHWGHAPAHGLFFALAGVAQIAWGIAFGRKPSAALHRAGIVMVGGLITIWIITRLLPAPFGDEPGEIDAIGVVSKLSEGLGLAGLVAVAVSGTVSGRRRASAWRTIGKFVTVSLAAGWLIYQIGMAVTPIFPWLGEQALGSDVVAAAWPRNSAPDDLQMVVAGIPSPFVNGSEVPVVSDLVTRLTVTPGDERYKRNVDLYLYRQTTSEPLDGATIQATARMRYMDHGTLQQMALPLGAGRYTLPLQFLMPGEWQLELEIAAPGAQGTVQLDIDLFE